MKSKQSELNYYKIEIYAREHIENTPVFIE